MNTGSDKKKFGLSLMSLIFAFIISFSSFATNHFSEKARLPGDVKPTCAADISPWFGGRVTANGWVQPANSLAPIFADFDNNTRCDFYKWGAQMFLWLTSGTGTKHVFNTSPGFYNVSVEENNEREFLTSDGLMRLTIRKGKTDKEIELGQAGGGDVLLSQKDSLVYYGLHANNVFALYTTGQKLGAFNNALWVSPDEDKACLAQYKSCASEVKGLCKKQFKQCTHNNFPSTKSQLQAVSEFAVNYGYPISDGQALAIELKTSWIDASTLTAAGQKQYVLTQAIVPTFNRSKPNGPWPVNGTTEKTLALVGMHVVGTVNGHPEMVWSTFEHVNNVPDNNYIYTTKKNAAKTVTYSSKGLWNFLPTNAAMPQAIDANAKVDSASGSSSPASIVSTSSQASPIIPIDNFRLDPWGNEHGNGSQADISNNTDLISINASVLSQLKAGDIRGNYIQTGGIWTAKGQIPSSGTDVNLRGSLNLANTTMETFYQTPNPNGFVPKNCFGCHSSSETEATEVSHIYSALQPLPKRQFTKKLSKAAQAPKSLNSSDK